MPNSKSEVRSKFSLIANPLTYITAGMEKTGNSDEYLDFHTKNWTEGKSLERFVSC